MDGYINKLVFCHLKADTENADTINVRINREISTVYGSFEDKIWTYALLDRAGLGAPLYATFKNGIAYGYISGKVLDITSARDPVMERY